MYTYHSVSIPSAMSPILDAFPGDVLVSAASTPVRLRRISGGRLDDGGREYGRTGGTQADSGEPLTLRLEIIVIDRGRNDSRLFAVVSPQPGDARIWALLRRLKTEFHQRSIVPPK
jgi:hypothetical protein